MDSFEFVPTSKEVLHESHFDILENNRQTAIDKVEMQRLMAAVKQEAEKATPGNPLPSWRSLGKEGNLQVDNLESPKYVAKRKWATPENITFAKAVSTNRETANEGQLEKKKYMYAANGVLSKMSLSKEIKDTVESEDVQKVFIDIGYDSFDYLEPLVGIIDKESKEKMMVYKYVKGVDMVKYYDDGFPTGTFAAFSKLNTTLMEKGIIPHDLSVEQFMVSEEENGKKKLYLIDTEMYYRK